MHLMICSPGHIPGRGLRKPQGSGNARSDSSSQHQAPEALLVTQAEARKQSHDSTASSPYCALCSPPPPPCAWTHSLPSASRTRLRSLLPCPLVRTAVSPDRRRLPSLLDSTTFHYLLSSWEVLLNVYLPPPPSPSVLLMNLFNNWLSEKVGFCSICPRQHCTAPRSGSAGPWGHFTCSVPRAHTGSHSFYIKSNAESL